MKALLSQAGLITEQIFNAKCTKHNIQRKKSPQPFWLVRGWKTILNYKLNWERVFKMNCLPVFRTRSCECGRELFQCCLFLEPLDWCLRLFAPLFGLFGLLCSFQEPEQYRLLFHWLLSQLSISSSQSTQECTSL